MASQELIGPSRPTPSQGAAPSGSGARGKGSSSKGAGGKRADGTGAGARSARRAERERRAASRARPATVLLVALLGCWAAAATWLAISNRQAADRLVDEAADLRLAHDAKVKALVYQIAGVAGNQLLEQDGLTGRLADIITRQVQLENRQSTLVLMADRMASGFRAADAPVGPAGAKVTDEVAQAPPRAPPRPDTTGRVLGPSSEPPTLRLGDPSPPDAPKPPGKRSGLELPASVEPRPPSKPESAGGVAHLPLRRQFEIIEGSIGRLEGGQRRVLASYVRALEASIGAVKAAIAEVGLAVGAAEPPRSGPVAASRRAAPDPFEGEVAQVEQQLGAAERWRGVADAVPFRTPLEGGGLTSNFGTRKDPFTGATTNHAGMDFRSPTGTPVRAAGGGRVVTADVSGGYGNLVEIDHGASLLTRYAHLSAFHVSVGQTVPSGAVVGLVGSTGRSTGPHLHYETRIAGEAVDPARFIRAGAALFGRPSDEVRPAEASASSELVED